MQEKESAGARLSGASPSRGGLRISTPICRTSHGLPRLVADVIGSRNDSSLRRKSWVSRERRLQILLGTSRVDSKNLREVLQNLYRGFRFPPSPLVRVF